ncbi:MAG TPA: tripartite tricarboxylate transporter substrate binding protein [Xanthobacteraceae bacterium]
MRYGVALAFSLAVAFGGTASAQTWPAKLIKAIVPAGAGSAVDLIPRTVFEPLSAQLGVPIVVENRAGAGNIIGANAVARSEPDGYTILANSSAHTITPWAFASVPYDTEKDFAAIIPLGNLPTVLIVSAEHGAKSLDELVSKAQAKPGSLNYASVGVATATHLSAERFRVSAGLQGAHIPFRGGPEALTEVIAGRVDFYFCPINTALPLIRDGKLRALAVSTPKRASALPDVPTTLEAGFANSDYTFWVGLFAPAKTPPEVIAKLHATTSEVLRNPALQQKLSALGVEPMPMSPAAFEAYVRNEIASNANLVKAAGIKVGQ